MEIKGSGEETNEIPGWTRSLTTTPMLSPENWSRILTHLSPQDFQSVINACPVWNELMTPKKNTILFPKVVNILAKHLSLETILECRKLNQDVQATVDDLVFNNCDLGSLSWRKFTEIGGSYFLTGHRKISRFMSLMESRPFPEDNPFVGGSVSTRSLIGETVEQTDRRVEAVRRVFSRYGHHVQKMKLSENADDSNPFEPATLHLHTSLLAFLPNLKSLEINGKLYDLWGEDMEDANLPRLDKLEELVISDLDVIYHKTMVRPFVFGFLEKYGHQLKTLSLGRTFLCELYHSNSLDTHLPNLKRLEIDTFDSDTLKMLANTKLQLEELCIDSGYCETVNISKLLGVVNHFTITLVKLDLLWSLRDCQVKVGEVNNVREMVVLPKLKKLRLPFDPRSEWILEFLRRSCKHLKEISLKVGKERSEIKRVNFMTRLYVHHLFCVLPELDKIEISGGFLEKELVINRKAWMD